MVTTRDRLVSKNQDSYLTESDPGFMDVRNLFSICSWSIYLHLYQHKTVSFLHIGHHAFTKRPHLGACSQLQLNRSVDAGMKEGNVLLYNSLNIFYLRLYGIIHIVKDHSDTERGNLLHELLLLLNSKGSFICTIPQTG